MSEDCSSHVLARKFLDMLNIHQGIFIGNDLNRSVNAAKNILARGLAQPVLSAGESDIAGRVNMEEITPEMFGVRPEDHVST